MRAYGCLACIYVCTVLKDTGKGAGAPGNWRYKCFIDAMWVLGIELMSSEEYLVLLTIKSFLAPFLFETRVCVSQNSLELPMYQIYRVAQNDFELLTLLLLLP